MQEIKKIDVFSFAKIYAIMGAVIGFIVGLLIAIFAGIFAGFAEVPTGLGIATGATAIVIVPVFYAVFGFIFGAIGAFLYNIVANWVGGIKIELE